MYYLEVAIRQKYDNKNLLKSLKTTIKMAPSRQIEECISEEICLIPSDMVNSFLYYTIIFPIAYIIVY